MEKLEKAVIKQLGYKKLNKECLETLNDISNHGAQSGWSGFIYYYDTADFFDKNKALILAELEELADDIGEDTLQMVCNFNCLKAMELKSTDVAKVIYGNEDSDNTTQVKNALAWFALEHVSHRQFEI